MEENKDLNQEALAFLKRDESGVYTEQDIVKAMVDFHQYQLSKLEHQSAIEKLTSERWSELQKDADVLIKESGDCIGTALSKAIHNMNTPTATSEEELYWWKMRNILYDRLDLQQP